MHRGKLNTPLGWLAVETGDWHVLSIQFSTHEPSGTSDYPLVVETIRQLAAYFSHDRREFDLPVEPAGTAFQRQVWEQVSKIAYGHTISYLSLCRMGSWPETHTRAVASANAANPLAIVIPCHRVIGSDGRLSGYAWGLHRKEWLLQFEKKKEQLSLFAGESPQVPNN